jgi:glycine/D-amino acid oxidase-like deaminating enzyme/nitrite reductase/ring-hydroxylating ferredoxin subunit
MQNDAGRTIPYWTETADLPVFGPVERDLKTDVCIVGAGIAGLSTAYQLVRRGRRVVVVDDGPPGGGETGRTTAHLASALDDRFYEIERVHGGRNARLAYESHAAAIDEIGRVVREEGIDCDFTRLDGYLILADGDEPSLLDRELAAAHRAGFLGVERVESVPALGRRPALRFPDQGQFHVVRYLSGLIRAITAGGGRIFSGSHADAIEGGSPARVTVTGKHRITADAVVVATNSPVSDMFVTHLEQAPYRTYVIGARIPVDAVPPALWWDTADPYHYVRLAGGGAARSHELLIVGGEDHKTGQAHDMDERWRCLEEWTRERFPGITEIAYRWSGQVMEPYDFMAYIGPNPDGAENVFIATGDSGQGMTHGTIASLLLPALIDGASHPWAELYRPARISPSIPSAKEWVKEQLNVAKEYVTGYVGRGDGVTVDEIAPGTGAVIARGVHKIAAYRAEDGSLHECSAVCTHLRCIVNWNDAEKTWDCPCHGSRFDPYGKVLNGPAVTPLEALGASKGKGARKSRRERPEAR